MACHSGPNLVHDNIGLYLDSVNKKSYNPDEILGSDAPNTWTAVTSLADEAWRGICYGNGRFVATATGGTNRVAYSTDGINWTETSASEEHMWYSVAYGNGTFVAVSSIWYSNDVDRVMTSGSGTSWVTRNATYNHMWKSVCFGNGYFVAVANGHYNGGSNANKRVMYSTTGYSWTEGPLVQGNSWQSICHGNGKFVAVASTGSQRVMYASDDDLDTWSIAAATEANSWSSVTYGNGKFVAVSNDGTNRVMYSTDGDTWSNSSISGVGANAWYGVTYGNGRFVAVASTNSNRVMYSTDGINWTTASSPNDDEPWINIAYGNGKFVATQLTGGGTGTSTNQLMYNTDAFTYPVLTDIVKGHTTTFNSDLPRSGSLDVFQFNGLDDYISFASSSDFTFGTGDFTFEFWANPDYFGNRGTFYDSRPSGGTTGITIGHESSSGEIRVYMNASSGSDIVVQSSDFATGEWQHIAVTRSSGTVSLYINGTLKDSGTRTSDLNNTNAVNIGYKTYTSSTYDYFDGKLSQVRVYKGNGFTSAEVNQNFYAHKRRFGL